MPGQYFANFGFRCKKMLTRQIKNQNSLMCLQVLGWPWLWSQNVSQLIKMMIATPFNTLPVERVYPYPEMICSPSKNNLKPEHLEALFLLATLKIPVRWLLFCFPVMDLPGVFFVFFLKIEKNLYISQKLFLFCPPRLQYLHL